MNIIIHVQHKASLQIQSAQKLFYTKIFAQEYTRQKK